MGFRTVMREDFESISPPDLPPGWVTVNANCDLGEWGTRGYGGVKWGKQCMRFVSDPLNPGDDWFFTGGVYLDALEYYEVFWKSRCSDSTIHDLDLVLCTAQHPDSVVSWISSESVSWWEYQGERAGGHHVYVPVSGTYYLGFHATSPPNSGRLYVDEIELWMTEGDLVLLLGATKEIEGYPAAYAPDDTIEVFAAVKNYGPTRIVNERLSVGRWPGDVELEFVVTGPDGIQRPCLNMYAKKGVLNASHFKALPTDSIIGKNVNLWTWYNFDMLGSYDIYAVYRNYSDPGGLGAWMGELQSGPITIVIE
jgi:hypothetical protein